MSDETHNVRASMIDSANDCMLFACARQWPKEFDARGHKLREQQNGVGRAVGTAAHKAVAYQMGEKLTTGSLGSVDLSIQAAEVEFRKEIKDGVQFDDVTTSAGTAIDQIARIAQSFAGLVGYKTVPKFVEQEFRAKPKQPGWTFNGHIDYLTSDLDLPDLKTGRRDKFYIGQMGQYSLALRSNGIIPRRIGVLLIPRTKLSENPAKPVPKWYDRVLAEQVAASTMTRTITQMETYMATGKLTSFAMNPNSFMCSEKGCPAWDVCPVGRIKSQGGKS